MKGRMNSRSFSVSLSVLLFLSVLVGLGVHPGRASAQNFDLPGILDLDSLPSAVDQYAEKVLTCLHVPDVDMTQGQKDWLCERPTNTGCIYDAVNDLEEPLTLEELERNRDTACSTIYQNLLDKKYCNRQYGNCGEGAMVNYCLAHKAKQKDIIRCSSENDHAFSLFLKKGEAGKKDTICLMDRWPLGPTAAEGKGKGDGQYFFCNVSVVNGRIHYKGKAMEGREWYKKVSCNDWMSEYGPRKDIKFDNLDVKSWNENYLVEKDFLNRKKICQMAGLSDNCRMKKTTFQIVNGKYEITFDFGNKGQKALERFHQALKDKIEELDDLEVQITSDPGQENKLSLAVYSIGEFVDMLE